MPLLHLCPELLLLIFDNVEPKFFREDLGRLTISKQWYRLALPVLYRDLDLSAESLDRLLNGDHAQSVATAVQKYTATIAVPETGTLFDDSEADWRNIGIEPQSSVTPAKVTRLHNILEGASRLRHLGMTRVQLSNLDPRTRYTRLSSWGALLSMPQLTSLDVDLCMAVHTCPYEGLHLCSVVGQLLPRLKRLCYRAANPVCAKLLVPPAGIHGQIGLEEVIVGVDVENIDLWWKFNIYPCRLSADYGSGLENSMVVRDEVEEQAKTLVSRLRAPKFVRVLSTYIPADSGNRDRVTDVYDAMADERVTLDGEEWFYHRWRQIGENGIPDQMRHGNGTHPDWR